MSIQKVIQESIAGNPLEMKEALTEELRNRVAEALAVKMEEVELDEAVEVRHDRYMRSHGKKARDTGQSGNWMFTHKSMGDVDYNDEKQVHTARGKFADAKKSAQQWAKKHGHSAVYVMEEVELGEAFKRGDILHVPGAGGTKHPAVHLGTKAVYLDDEGAVEHVPHEALKNAEIATRVPAKHKMLAKQYLDNMKEEVELDEALKIGTKVRIHAPGKYYHGKIGHVGEIRKHTYGTMAPSYTVDYREPGEEHNRSISLSREKIKLHREEVDLSEETKKMKDGYYVTNQRNSEVTHDKPFNDSKSAISHADKGENKTGYVHRVHKVKDGKIDKQWEYNGGHHEGGWEHFSDFKGDAAHQHMRNIPKHFFHGHNQ